MSTYKKIIFGAVTAAVCVAVVFGFQHKTEQMPESSEMSTYPANTTSSEKNGSDEKNDHSSKYYIALEGDLLCAYLVENGESELLHSAKAVPLLMSDEDIKKLNRGIYAESYEDLWMYFESYSS